MLGKGWTSRFPTTRFQFRQRKSGTYCSGCSKLMEQSHGDCVPPLQWEQTFWSQTGGCIETWTSSQYSDYATGPMCRQKASAAWKSQESFLRTRDNDGVGEDRIAEQRIGNYRRKHGRGRTWYRQLTGTRLGLRSKYLKRIKFEESRQSSMLTVTPRPLKPKTACSWWISPAAVSTDVWYHTHTQILEYNRLLYWSVTVIFVCSSRERWNGCVHYNSYSTSRKPILWQSFQPPLNYRLKNNALYQVLQLKPEVTTKLSSLCTKATTGLTDQFLAFSLSACFHLLFLYFRLQPF